MDSVQDHHRSPLWLESPDSNTIGSGRRSHVNAGLTESKIKTIIMGLDDRGTTW